MILAFNKKTRESLYIPVSLSIIGSWAMYRTETDYMHILTVCVKKLLILDILIFPRSHIPDDRPPLIPVVFRYSAAVMTTTD